MAPKPMGRYGGRPLAKATPLADGTMTPSLQSRSYLSQSPLGPVGLDPSAAPTDPTQGAPAQPTVYQTPGGATTSPQQATDESFNNNLRDVSTDLGDISGTNSRRAIEYLQQGQGLENQAAAASAGYSGDYATARNNAQGALSQLQQTPGYTPQEASQINVDYSKYDTSPDALNQRYLTQGEQAGITGNPNAPAGVASGMGNAIYSTLGSTANKADTALENEGSLMGTNLGEEEGKLSSAVDPSKLGLSSDFTNNYKMTPQQQQDLVTAAGTTVGNRYRSAESDLERAAAANGNTSPLAVAAARQQLEDSSAAQSGDAMTQARIDASNAAAGRLQTEEGMRIGTAQDIASREQQNAQTVGSQAQQAIESYGQQGLSEADTQRQAALQGVEAGGEAALAASEYGDTTASQRAAELAGNRQQTTADVQNTQYQQGVQTGQLTSQGAEKVGTARQAGTQAYISGETGQENIGQQGQLTSQQQQTGAFTAGAGAANTAEGIGTTATADTRGQGIGDKASSGVGSLIGSLEDGGVVGDPSSDDGSSKTTPGPIDEPAPLRNMRRYGVPDDTSTAAPGATAPDNSTGVQGAAPGSNAGVLAALLDDGGMVGQPIADDDPMAQPNDPSAYADPNNGVSGANSPTPGFGTRLRNALTDQANRYNPNSGSTNPNPMRSFVQGEVMQGVGALADRLEDGGMTGRYGEPMARGGFVAKPTLALVGERGPEMVVPMNRTPTTKVPPSTLKTAAAAIPGVGGIPRYTGMRPGGPPNGMRPMKPMRGSLAAR